jgi:hypothetical protein
MGGKGLKYEFTSNLVLIKGAKADRCFKSACQLFYFTKIKNINVFFYYFTLLLKTK